MAAVNSAVLYDGDWSGSCLRNSSWNVTGTYELCENQFEVLKEITALITALGLFSTITSSVAITVIVKSPELHSKSFFLISFCSVNDFVAGVAYFTFGLYRLSRSYDVESLHISQCCWRVSVMFYSQTFNVFLAVVLAVDRAVAIFKPVFYRSISFRRFHLPMIAVSWVASVIETMLMIVASSNADQVVKFCESNECLGSTTAVHVYQGITVLLVVIVVLFSTAIIRLTHSRNAVLKRCQRRTKRVKMHLTVMKTEAVVLIVITFSQICGRMCVLIAYSLSSRFVSTIFISVFRILMAATAASNFFIYVFRSSKFRASLKKLLLQRNVIYKQCS